jgi:hypothetical protein
MGGPETDVTPLELGAAETVGPLLTVASPVGLMSVSVGLGVAVAVDPHPVPTESMTAFVQAA